MNFLNLNFRNGFFYFLIILLSLHGKQKSDNQSIKKNLREIKNLGNKNYRGHQGPFLFIRL